jgi:hypothetical protein
MRKLKRKIPRVKGRHNKRRPFMIDVEEFDFMDDIEEMLAEWMLGSSGGLQ